MFFLFYSFLMATGTAFAVDLAAAYQSAIHRSETIADQNEQIVQAEEHYHQAMGAIYPSISGQGSYLKQDAGGGTNLFPTDQPVVKLALTQPLFRGLREWHALKQTRTLAEAQRESRQQALQQLYYDTAQSFFTVLSLERDIQNLQEEIEYNAQRIKELRTRVRIGRSRVTEVLTVQASMGSLRAQQEQMRGQLRATRELFAFQTGLARDTALEDGSQLPSQLEGIDHYAGRRDDRPEVRLAQLKLDAAREGVTVAKGARWPSADFAGNYYFVRYGALQNVKWDLQFTVSVPIFQGGLIDAGIQVASSQEQQSELALSLNRRQVDDEIHTFYENVQSDLRQLKELSETAEISERNFREETKEYRLGLVTNLDVLQALTSYEESKRALDRAFFAGKLDYAKLQAATGQVAALQRGH